MVVVDALWVIMALAGVAAIVWGADTFAENLASASVALKVSPFALALLLAGAEPEELATAVVATLRDAPAIAFGDVIGANVAICLVALAVGAIVAPLPFDRGVRLYGILGLPLGVLCAVLAWDGDVGRLGGLALLVTYLAYVALIWRLEGAPPSLGEVGEVAESREGPRRDRRVSKEVGFLLAGVVAMAVGATALVDAIRHLANAEDSQTALSLTLVGFATAFELVVLAWSAQRKGASEAVVAAVVGSFAYNATMTLGAAAVVRPLKITDATSLHMPLAVMVLSLFAVLVLAAFRNNLRRRDGLLLIFGYTAFTIAVVARTA